MGEGVCGGVLPSLPKHLLLELLQRDQLSVDCVRAGADLLACYPGTAALWPTFCPPLPLSPSLCPLPFSRSPCPSPPSLSPSPTPPSPSPSSSPASPSPSPSPPRSSRPGLPPTCLHACVQESEVLQVVVDWVAADPAGRLSDLPELLGPAGAVRAELLPPHCLAACSSEVRSRGARGAYVCDGRIRVCVDSVGKQGCPHFPLADMGWLHVHGSVMCGMAACAWVCDVRDGCMCMGL